MKKRRRYKRYIRLAAKTLVYALAVTAFTFVAVPVMEMLMTSYGSRAVIHLAVCMGFGLWLGEKVFIRKEDRM